MLMINLIIYQSIDEIFFCINKRRLRLVFTL